MTKCGSITRSGERCRGVAIDSSGLCYAHHPDHADTRRRNASKGGKRGGRGRPVVELRAVEDKLEDLADAVLGDRVEPSVAAVVVQIRNAQIRAISTGLKAKEQEELEARISELESLLESRNEGGQWQRAE